MAAILSGTTGPRKSVQSSAMEEKGGHYGINTYRSIVDNIFSIMVVIRFWKLYNTICIECPAHNHFRQNLRSEALEKQDTFCLAAIIGQVTCIGRPIEMQNC